MSMGYNLRDDILRGMLIVKISLVQLVRTKRGFAIIALSLLPSILTPFMARPSNNLQAERLFVDVNSILYIGIIIPLICLMLGATSINAEIDERTIVQVMVRPIRRIDFVFWKYIGVVIAAFVIAVCDSLIMYITFAGNGSVSVELLYDVWYLSGICVIVYSSIFIFISFAIKKPLLWGVFIILFDRLLGFIYFIFSGSLSIANHIMNIGSDFSSLFTKLANISSFESSLILAIITIVSFVLSVIMFQFKDIL